MDVWKVAQTGKGMEDPTTNKMLAYVGVERQLFAGYEVDRNPTFLQAFAAVLDNMEHSLPSDVIEQALNALRTGAVP